MFRSYAWDPRPGTLGSRQPLYLRRYHSSVAETPAVDPTEQNFWRPLRLLQRSMDADLARIYSEARIGDVKTSWVGELIRLDARGPMTISQLAESFDRTHSAESQKVADMRAAGLVRTVAGEDARTKRVVLTAKAKRLVARLAAEWRVTEEAVAELDAELPYPLTQVVADMAEALARKSFHDRVMDKLAQERDWKGAS